MALEDGFAELNIQRVGYVEDYISGALVRATPEEVDAVQVMARRLVDDLGYPKAHIRTRPQFRVARRPSDSSKSYPIDIGVFASTTHNDESLSIIVECKKRHRKEGVAQLKRYLDLSSAHLGVWFNGDEHEYLRKHHHLDGRITYESLPSLPRYGQRIEDIGRFRRRDLRPPSNLKAVFRDIRNHLAGMTTGITRDEALAQELINILFCKIHDELSTAHNDVVTFRAGFGEAAATVKARLLELFETVKAVAFEDVFNASDIIRLDAESVRYVVGELQQFCLVDAERDAIGEAFEVFIGPALRGAEGQFFTPRNVVKMIVDIVDPRPGEKIIDPACGSGGFLITSLTYVWEALREEAKAKSWTDKYTAKKESDVAGRYFFGVEKDAFLARVTRAYMALIGDGRTNIHCENTLAPIEEWSRLTQERVLLGTFDVVLTNPPFGQKIAVKGSALLSQYELGHRWVRDSETGAIEQSDILEGQRPPQIIFLERCLQLLRPGGRLGIVLPESILGNPSYEYVLEFLKRHATVTAVVTLPDPLFKTSGKGGTHTKVCALFATKRAAGKADRIFMSDVRWCGHDTRGNPTIRRDDNGKMVLLDEVPFVARRYRAMQKPRAQGSRLGFVLRVGDLAGTILVPKYYDPAIRDELNRLCATHDLITLGDLVSERVISVATGVEVGRMAYGTGAIPFIRTSDLSNWELKADFKQGVSQEIYEEYRVKGEAKAGDILIVRDGTYLIGTSAVVTEGDVPMLFQGHLFRLRVLKPKIMSPWLLFACLNTPIVKRQFRAKQFTQDIIDTIGRRLFEIAIPVPKEQDEQHRIATETRKIIETRAAMRERAKALVLDVEGIKAPNEDELEAVEGL